MRSKYIPIDPGPDSEDRLENVLEYIEDRAAFARYAYRNADLSEVMHQLAATQNDLHAASELLAQKVLDNG